MAELGRKGLSMRDVMFEQLYKLMGKDKNIVLVIADQTAPSLVKILLERSAQITHVGIAEQQMMGVAAGLASEGMIPFTYCIAPFATLRPYEQIKLNSGLMKFPIKIIGIGAGFSYEDSGPTHYTTEDIAVMRAVPNLEIISPADGFSISSLVEKVCYSGKPAYLRIDRQRLPDIYMDGDKFEEGFKEIAKGDKKCIVATGRMVSRALEVKERYDAERSESLGVVDVYRLKPLNSEGLAETLSQYKNLVSLEEHLPQGGLGSIVSELITDNSLPLTLKRIAVPEGYYYHYMRDNIHKQLGLDVDSIMCRI